MDEQNRQAAEKLVEKIKELVKEGGASRVLLMRNGDVLLNLSLNTGVIGAVVGLSAAPFAVLTAALVSFGMDCEVMIEKAAGSTWNLRDPQVGYRLEEIKFTVKEKAKDIFHKA